MLFLITCVSAFIQMSEKSPKKNPTTNVMGLSVISLANIIQPLALRWRVLLQRLRRV